MQGRKERRERILSQFANDITVLLENSSDKNYRINKRI